MRVARVLQPTTTRPSTGSTRSTAKQQTGTASWVLVEAVPASPRVELTMERASCPHTERRVDRKVERAGSALPGELRRRCPRSRTGLLSAETLDLGGRRMIAYLDGAGFLGAEGSMGADLTLVAMLVAFVLLTAGVVLARARRYAAHRWMQTAAVILNAVPVVVWMHPLVLALRASGPAGESPQLGPRAHHRARSHGPCRRRPRPLHRRSGPTSSRPEARASAATKPG